MDEDILDILESVNPDANWELDYLAKIENNMSEYEKGISRRSSDSIDAIAQQYLTPILPLYWEVFHTHNEARRQHNLLPTDCHYDIGIFLVGYRKMPVLLNIAELQPREKIYFLYSEETESMLPSIATGIDDMLGEQPEFKALVNLVKSSVQRSSGFALKIKKSSDPVETFKLIKQILDKVDNKTVALDVTAGKKTMISGGFTAGSIWSDCDMFYVDALTYDPFHNRPNPGTEFLSRLEDPYDVYNVQSIGEAKKLFRAHNYEAAANLLESVSEKLDRHATRYGLQNEQDAVQKHLEMATCYRLWDAFDYDQARGHKGSWGYDKHMKDSIDVLDILSGVVDKRTLFADEGQVIHFAVDRYQNAMRRKESDRLEDAIVRFTQVIEILCNYKIYRIAQDGNLVDQSRRIVQNTVGEIWNISPLICFLFGEYTEYRSRYKTYRIQKNSALLSEGDYAYTANTMIDFITCRNDFVHANKSMTQAKTETDTENLQKLSLEFLKNFSKFYCKTTGLSFDDLQGLHRFKKMPTQ